MGSTDIQRTLDELGLATWAYAAVGTLVETGLLERLAESHTAAELAEQTGLSTGLVASLLDVAVALGLASRSDERFFAGDGLIPLLTGAQGRGLRHFLRSDFLQTGDLVRRAQAGTLRPGWHYTDPDILNAQGIGSGAIIEHLSREVVPRLEGLTERLSAPAAAFLDVGAGVGAICVTLAHLWPSLRVVGLEPAEAPLAQARRRVADSDVGDRIELRPIRLDELTDVDRFDAAWLPQVFLPLEVLRRSLGPFYRAIKPGGWAILFTLSVPGAELAPAIARFRNVLWGGEPLQPDAVAELMAQTGFTELGVETAQGVANSKLVIGRKPA